MPDGRDARSALSPTALAAADPALDAAFAAGRAAHPSLSLARDAFEAHARQCAARRRSRQGDEPGAGERVEGPRAQAAADLYLVAACVARCHGAWERLHELHAARLVALASGRGAPALEAEQHVQDLLGDLTAGALDPGRSSLIEQFDGSGSLFAWLATCLLRRIGARARAARRTKSLPDADTLTGASAADPSHVAERAELEGRLRVALRGALESMSPKERAAVVLSSRDGWSGEETARLLGVGPPRVSRLRARGTERIREAVLPLVRSPDWRGTPDIRTWEALRDAVTVALSRVAIPEEGRALRDERASSREDIDG